MARALPYASAIKWIADNDDTEWVSDEAQSDGALSVAAALAADIYGKSDLEVANDLRKELKKRRTKNGI